MTTAFTVAELVPHSGKMSLLDNIIAYGEDWLQAQVFITADSMFAEPQGVPAWIGLEYMAQTIGAFSGLQERLSDQPPKLGFLVGTRKYLCSAAYFPLGQTLTIKVQRELQADNGLGVFSCSLESQDISATARLNVFQPEDGKQFLKDAML
ncbi:hotdog family protein [Neptunomonas antarctica]|uniref:Predicted 3-hydroxylacyl-ACP dehydratase, HotDog domain n=1 Tax=Neptunomonas antarctica TaxID=619304 RepID=A0A1N7IT35_9GAMM|nr:hotdog family protein [Neptunomonas antarctica]SIS40200.1 Predicted 3-hydroxylacyl-ACP dehydratase, HotDog domain [Neptunomonas antarctica]